MDAAAANCEDEDAVTALKALADDEASAAVSERRLECSTCLGCTMADCRPMPPDTAFALKLLDSALALKLLDSALALKLLVAATDDEDDSCATRFEALPARCLQR